MLVFQAPRDQFETRQSVKKKPRNKHAKKTPILLQSARKSFKLGPQIWLWTTGGTFCCSYGFKGLPQGAKMIPRDAKMEKPCLQVPVLDTKNDRARSENHSDFEQKPGSNIHEPTNQHSLQQRHLAKQKSKQRNRKASGRGQVLRQRLLNIQIIIFF